MREWLFNVMKELSDRRELSYHYQQLKKEAEVKIFSSCVSPKGTLFYSIGRAYGFGLAECVFSGRGYPDGVVVWGRKGVVCLPGKWSS